MKKTGDSGALSIDFLIGFTIFMLAFIWVISMIPGLLINLQGYTIDYDAVAYRTGVILAEDPGEPPIPAWEKAPTPNDVVRFGLSLSKDTPNILSEEKVNQFFCTSVFSYPSDYHERVIFGDYPYRFNISLTEVESDHPSQYVGDIMSGSYGTIRRLVKIKGPSNATINYTYMNNHGYIRGDNETQHEFSIVINNTELLKDKVTDPIYQINPALEKITVNITDLNKTMYADRESCFNVSLKRVYIYVEDEKITPLHLYYTPIINGIQYEDLTTDALYDTKLPKDIKNISLVLSQKTLSWTDYSHVYINLTFDLVKTNVGCACPTCPGSQFLNNTPGIPFDYNYHPDNVTQPNLREATLEVSVGSGYLTATEMLIKPLKADFVIVPVYGSTVRFLDKSTGSPVDWAWTFGDGNTSTLNSPTHTFPGPGSYTVSLTVKDASGNPDTKSRPFDLLAPGPDFIAAPVSGPAPLPVIFTDKSSNTPTAWKWEYNKTVSGSWTLFSTSRNPTFNFPAGTYDIRLTANNTVGGNSMTKLNYITAIPLPVANLTANQTNGVLSLPVKFTDTSTNGPILSWKWENKTGAGSWMTFSTIQNPTFTFPTGVHDIQLTVTNSAGSNTKTMNGYIVVTATPNPHNITISEGSGGIINPNKTVTYPIVTVNDGANVIFTIIPNAGYHIVNVVDNGTSYGAISSYSLNNVKVDHTIGATFAVNTPQTLYYNNFDPSTSLNDWTISGTVTRYTGGGSSNPATGYRNGTASAYLRSQGQMTRPISTTGYKNIVVSFAMGASSLEAGETITAQWSPDGSTWTNPPSQVITNTANLNYYSLTLPVTADNRANFAIRFMLSTGTGSTDYGYVDDVRVIGTAI
jgi:PKD repeat protein